MKSLQCSIYSSFHRHAAPQQRRCLLPGREALRATSRGLPARQPCQRPLSRRICTPHPVASAAAAAAVPGGDQGPSAVSRPDTEVCQPPAIYQRIVGKGTKQAAQPGWKTVLLGLLAGAYVGFGALLMLNTGYNSPGLLESNPGLQKLVAGVFGLPFGLAMVLICGAELFTGNTCSMAVALYEGNINLGDLIKNWVLSYAGNLAGCLALVWAISVAGLQPPLAGTAKIAVAKTSLTLPQAFVRGCLANWLVNLAVWQAAASTSIPGKVTGLMIPIITFMGCGFEHSVANMFLIPMGIFMGADISWRTFFVSNLLPVTLGNIVGGAVLVGASYSLAFGRLGGQKSA